MGGSKCWCLVANGGAKYVPVNSYTCLRGNKAACVLVYSQGPMYDERETKISFFCQEAWKKRDVNFFPHLFVSLGVLFAV